MQPCHPGHLFYFFFFSESYVADFDGRSSLLYRFNQKSMSTLKDVISLRFKSHQAEGVLLHGEGQRGDYITLELHRGRLDLYLNLGASSNTFPLSFMSYSPNVFLIYLFFSLPQTITGRGSAAAAGAAAAALP